jgi:ABC-type branched-subunit amino acid transport system substrate-binding protein
MGDMDGRTRARVWAVAAGSVLALAACGTGGSALRPASVTGAPPVSGPGQPAAGPAGGAPATPAQAAQVAPGPQASKALGGAPPPAARTGGTGGAAPAGGRGAGLPAPGAAVPGAAVSNPASDVGVTRDTINLGLINFASANRSLGPPIALASQRIVDALVRHINASGGVAGRRLTLLTCDDGGDVTRARACYEKLKGRVFAFVPGESWLYDVIHDQLAADRIPWLSRGWFASEYQDPYMFPCHANGLREATNLARWVAVNLHPQTVGILYLNVSEDIAARDAATRVLEEHGIRVVQTVPQEWDSPDESQHVLAMRVANPDFVLSYSWPAPVAKFFHDAQGQNWIPKLGFAGNHLTGDPGYGPILGDYVKGHLLTITSYETWGQGQAATDDNLPTLRLWQQLTARYTGTDLSGFHFRYVMGHHETQAAIACVRAFAEAAQQLGAELTRTRLIDYLETHSFDTGMGVTLRWPHGDHGREPYSFNREFLYEWVGAPDGGYDLKRVLPDPVNG